MSHGHTLCAQATQTAQAMRESAIVFEHSYEGIMVVSTDFRIVRVNPAFSRITGYSPEDVLGQNPRILASGRQEADFYEGMWHTIRENGFWRGEIWNRHKSGEVFPELLSVFAVPDSDGIVQSYVGVFIDINGLKTRELDFYRIASHDLLTGLPDRRLLGDRLDQAQARARRTGKLLAVCYLDLDGFKAVNDQHGHAVGDKLLIQVADLLKGVLRTADTLARLGGDEFVLLLSDLQDATECECVARRVLRAVNVPLDIEGRSLCISASMGVTLFPLDDSDADMLLRHADQAMYLAKESGKNCHVVFDTEHDRLVQARFERLQRLRLALGWGEFVLHYQPKVDLITGEVVGAEALIRWQHPELGLLQPGAFLADMEGSDLDARVGHWVVEEVLQQMLHWQSTGLNLQVSANVSATHLLHPDFVLNLRSLLQRYPDVAPARLELEIVETTALADMERAVSVLEACKGLGVSFSLDDFGTGYSSLAYFRRLPVHMIKIDQSFVCDMLTDDNDFGIVESVVRLAQAFNRLVIAEGVETLEHGARLLQLGCHLAQGYGIARPMPPSDLPRWIERWTAEEPWRKLTQDHRILADTASG